MKFHIEDDELTIKLVGGEMFWAIKRKLVVRRTDITGLQWHETLVVPRREIGWRVGTAWPGGLWAGRFYAPGSRNFLYVQRIQGLFGQLTMAHVLVFQLTDSTFQRLFLTVNDPDLAQKLIAWWSGTS